MMRTAAERSAELCAQMLDYAGISPMGMELLDIEVLVSELTPLLRTSLPGGASLEVERLGDLPPVKGNASQIRQIIMILAVNGAEAIQGQGRVIIRTGQRTMDRCDFADSLIEDSPDSRGVRLPPGGGPGHGDTFGHHDQDIRSLLLHQANGEGSGSCGGPGDSSWSFRRVNG